jgi:hypothetical protein
MNSSQPHIVVDAAAGKFEVKLTPEERNHILARAGRHALKMAAMATGCWYVIWFAGGVNTSAWMGLAIFAIACVLGYALAWVLLQRAVAEELRRRGALLKFVHEYRKQQSSISERQETCP